MKWIDETGLTPQEVRKRQRMATFYGVALVIAITYTLIAEYLL